MFIDSDYDPCPRWQGGKGLSDIPAFFSISAGGKSL
jgi:hypothetical protein